MVQPCRGASVRVLRYFTDATKQDVVIVEDICTIFGSGIFYNILAHGEQFMNIP